MCHRCYKCKNGIRRHEGYHTGFTYQTVYLNVTTTHGPMHHTSYYTSPVEGWIFWLNLEILMVYSLLCHKIFLHTMDYSKPPVSIGKIEILTLEILVFWSISHSMLNYRRN